MKPFQRIHVKTLGILLVLGILIFSACKEDQGGNGGGDTNTDGLTNRQRATRLTDTICHFISKAQIEEFSKRYDKWKKDSDNAAKNLPQVLNDSCSFSKTIVQAILSQPKCIGLRVIYGLDSKYKFHIMLVGIADDYSTIYIKKSQSNCPTIGKPPVAYRMQADSANQESGREAEEEGGGEMGQIP